MDEVEDDEAYVYSDMDKSWLATRSTYAEGATVIVILLLNVLLLGVFIAMIVHLLLTIKHSEGQYYSGKNAYVRISEYLFTGKSRKAFKNLSFIERQTKTAEAEESPSSHEVPNMPPEEQAKDIESEHRKHPKKKTKGRQSTPRESRLQRLLGSSARMFIVEKPRSPTPPPKKTPQSRPYRRKSNTKMFFPLIGPKAIERISVEKEMKSRKHRSKKRRVHAQGKTVQ